MGKKGVLLMNVGTPDEPTVASVRTYLREFLLDPDVIDIPAPLRHLLVRGIILRTRPRKIAPLYKSIWMEDGSPLRVYSKRVTENLRTINHDIEFEFAMRYGNPSIRSGLEKLKASGVTDLLLLPMFPHYAQATTESSLKHAHKELGDMKWQPTLLEMGHFETAEEFIGPLTESIRPHLDDDTHLLFSTTVYPCLTSSELTVRRTTVRPLRLAARSSAKRTASATVGTATKPPWPSWNGWD